MALRSDSTKSLRTRARARLDSSFMCSAPPASGAAIRNARSAGPSGAPKSTAGFSRANPIEAVSTYGERQCGIAIPPGSPVADCSSRAIAAAIRPSVSCGAAGVGEPVDEPADDGLLVAAGIDVEQDQIGVDDRLQSGACHGDTFVLVVGEIGAIGVTRTALRSICGGRGERGSGQCGGGAAVGDGHLQPLRR